MLDFLGIGAQKAGTTWLYEMLRLHPQVSFPAGKEVHFWDDQRDRGIVWYQSLFAGEESGRKKGEITPAYAILPVEAIRDIHAINPALRSVYIIRNPVERAWSSALMALGRAEMTIDEASDQWFIDHFRSAGSLARGDYEQCIRNWRSVFPSEQLLVLRHEEIRSEPLALLTQCCRHLGIDEKFFAAAGTELLGRRVFSGPGHTIRPGLLPVLREIYCPKIRSLGEYLGADLGPWLET